MLREHFNDIVVLGRLKEDIEILVSRASTGSRDLILGVALSTTSTSRIEPVAINNFNGKNIIKDGPMEVPLFVPKINMNIASTPTTSFCNYATYRLSVRIQEEGIKTCVAFVHIASNDLLLLKQL